MNCGIALFGIFGMVQSQEKLLLYLWLENINSIWEAFTVRIYGWPCSQKKKKDTFEKRVDKLDYLFKIEINNNGDPVVNTL